jgi:hypothetical protein
MVLKPLVTRRLLPRPAELLIHHKTGDSREPLCAAFGGKPSILAVVINARKLFFGAVLAPPHRLVSRVD